VDVPSCPYQVLLLAYMISIYIECKVNHKLRIYIILDSAGQNLCHSEKITDAIDAERKICLRFSFTITFHIVLLSDILSVSSTKIVLFIILYPLLTYLGDLMVGGVEKQCSKCLPSCSQMTIREEVSFTPYSKDTPELLLM
jgi:hypothetical protein